MNQEISSLMDGELEPQEAERIIRACGLSEDHKDTWHLYHVIGESLRGQAPRTLARQGRVMAALEQQPTVLAPRRRMPASMGRVALAAAASVATIGVVGWIGMQQGTTGTSSTPVAGSPAAAIKPVAATATVVPPAQPATAPIIEVQDYLAAHRQIPSPDLYRPAANRAAAGAR
jgi:sigma-E factor negative regulatory protein RseA